jgi:hypothetical protein
MPESDGLLNDISATSARTVTLPDLNTKMGEARFMIELAKWQGAVGMPREATDPQR